MHIEANNYKRIVSVVETNELESVIQKVKLSHLHDVPIRDILEILVKWGSCLNPKELGDIPGLAFLKMWLRRGTLEPIIIKELGEKYLEDEWNPLGRQYTKAFPVGTIGHWAAGNIEIQPILSMICGLLGRNKSLVRVSGKIVESVERIIDVLYQVDSDRKIIASIAFVTFDHNRQDLHEIMASAVDGAMIWGGEDAILRVRSLPFPHWARFAFFGPRISIALMDKGAWSNENKCVEWCRRLARDVWQFDQKACSSPQTLFIEKGSIVEMDNFLKRLGAAFEEECKAHPRKELTYDMASNIVKSRANWLLSKIESKGCFPETPEWTILFDVCSGMPEIPHPTQGKVLTVIAVDNLVDVASILDGNVQTVGMGMSDTAMEKYLSHIAGGNGADRIMRLGQMHTFSSPWDGQELIKPMTRVVSCVASE